MAKEINLYNSLSNKKETLKPYTDNIVKIYHCGPTVYKRQHLGNMRRFLFADFLGRTIRNLGYQTKEITNITDVGHLTQDDIESGQDKLEKEAEQKNTTPQKIASRQTEIFFQDLKKLNVSLSDKYPRATDNIRQMQELIKKLLDKGFAYQTDIGVFFDITKFKKYGQLSGNTIEQLARGHRLEVRSEKLNPGDFALWLTDNPKQIQQWQSPWGEGYPGWHIECSAMSIRYLGEQIDIHTGGEDNKFPHHENEIAQSEAVTGKPFVQIWIHNAHLQMKGQKMAKREGEQLTIDSVIEHGFSPLAFRLLVFAGHYRTKIDFSWEKITEAQENINSVTQLLKRLTEQAQPPNEIDNEQTDNETTSSFFQALSNDLNTPLALSVFYNYVKQTNKKLNSNQINQKEISTAWHTLLKMDQVLGIITSLLKQLDQQTIPEEISKLAAEREKARKNKNFQQADKIRQQIESSGYEIKDTKSGPKLQHPPTETDTTP